MWKEKTLQTKTKKTLILEQVSIIDVMEYYGIDISGDKIVCPLPSHSDNIASFVIYKETNSFFCFGCNASSNVIDFVMAMDNCSFVEAIDKLMPMRKKNAIKFNKKENFKEKYLFNISCDLRDFLYGLREFSVYEDEIKRVESIFKKLDEKMEQVDSFDEKQFIEIQDKITDYITTRKKELMEKLDGYNEERI